MKRARYFLIAIKITFNHTFEIKNEMPFSLDDAKVIYYWPMGK